MIFSYEWGRERAPGRLWRYQWWIERGRPAEMVWGREGPSGSFKGLREQRDKERETSCSEEQWSRTGMQRSFLETLWILHTSCVGQIHTEAFRHQLYGHKYRVWIHLIYWEIFSISDLFSNNSSSVKTLMFWFEHLLITMDMEIGFVEWMYLGEALSLSIIS